MTVRAKENRASYLERRLLNSVVSQTDHWTARFFEDLHLRQTTARMVVRHAAHRVPLARDRVSYFGSSRRAVPRLLPAFLGVRSAINVWRPEKRGGRGLLRPSSGLPY
jgi:hypothetical protein